jgi:hypothetical protein
MKKKKKEKKKIKKKKHSSRRETGAPPELGLNLKKTYFPVGDRASRCLGRARKILIVNEGLRLGHADPCGGDSRI